MPHPGIHRARVHLVGTVFSQIGMLIIELLQPAHLRQRYVLVLVLAFKVGGLTDSCLTANLSKESAISPLVLI